MKQVEDWVLIEQLHRDDVAALDTLYKKYAAKIYEFSNRLIHNPSEAEDVTHDVFCKVWEYRHKFNDVVSFKGYLFRMTRNEIFNIYKRRHVNYKFTDYLQKNWKGQEVLDSEVLTNDLLEIISHAIAQMPERRRQIFCMSRYEEMSYEEIAKALDISPKTVQYHIVKALAELRKIISLFIVTFI